MGFNKLA